MTSQGVRQGPLRWFAILIAGVLLVAPGLVAIVAAGQTTDSFVRHLFETVLERTPDAAEVAPWSDLLARQPDVETARTVVRDFFGSAEFTHAVTVTPSTFGIKLYQVVLGRAPDAATLELGKGFILDQFNSLMPGFLAFPEFSTLRATTSSSAYITRLFGQALGRAPSAAEMASWDPVVARGDYVAAAIAVFSSDEYTHTARSLAQHVRLHYRALLGREPADAEVGYWAAELAARLGALGDFLVTNNPMLVAARIQEASAVPPGTFLTATDVVALVNAAQTAVSSTSMVIAVVDRMGNPLAVFRQPGAPDVVPGNFGTLVSANELAVSEARTGAFFSNNQAPLSSRTVRNISGVNFPLGIRNRPNGALYGIENTNRGCSLNTAFNAGKAIQPAQSINGLPCNPFIRIGCGLGIATGKSDLVDTDPTAVNPGGIPVFKDGILVGGIGVAGVSSAVAEFASLVAAFTSIPGFGLVPPDPGVVILDGIQLPFVEQRTQPPGTTPGEGNGSYLLGPSASPLGGGGVPDGWLIGPLSGSRLTAAQVSQIVSQAVSQAQRTRAAIRLPLGSTTAMVISVADLDGSLLGVFRMPDATVFSIDVATAKSRNVVYFSSLARIPSDMAGVPPGTAVTNRTISFGAQPFYPPGINGSGQGPFFNVYVLDTAVVCSQASQPPNRNQSGIVFFPGSTPLYLNGEIVGGLGVSGDGVEQDDLVTAAGATNFAPPVQIRADQIFVEGLRLPYFKFPRNPEDL
jgi:uncharacterized protein GlcG (DUF336 family)